MRTLLALAVVLAPATAHAFDKEGHFALMIAAAELAGYTHAEAIEIASANSAVDESGASDPYPRIAADIRARDPLRAVESQVQFHAFGTPFMSLEDQRAAIKGRREELYKQAKDTNDLSAFGVFEHFVGDSHSHAHGDEPIKAGLGQGNCFVHSGHGEHDAAEEVRMKALVRAALTLDPDAIATFVVETERSSHLVDQLTTRREVTRAMLRDTYSEMVKFAKDTGRDLKPPVSEAEALQILDGVVADPAIVQWDHDKGSGVARKNVPDFSVPLNRYIRRELRDRGAPAIEDVPSYAARRAIIVSGDGSTLELKVTEAALRDVRALPLPRGEREVRHAEQDNYEVYVGTTTLRGIQYSPTTPLPPQAALQIQTMVDTADEKGVRIRYDREALRNAVAGAHATGGIDLQADAIVKRVAAAPGELAVPLESGVVAIPMSRVTAQSALNVARVVGYVLDNAHGDVILLATTGASRLELADLVAIVDAVWQRGVTPLCSLDPLPGHAIEDGFHARVEGVPEQSHVGRVMLDADFDMKRINMGLLPGPPELKTVFDRQLERGSVGAVEGDTDRGHLSRFWLTPIQPTAGDIQVSGGGRLVLFASHVQVRTEIMLMADDGLVGTHAADPADEEGARDFTQRYRAIAGVHDSLARLEAIFDVTLMAGLLREQVPSHPQLARIAGLPIASAPYADADYPAVRRESGGAAFVMTGGVDAAFPRARAAVALLPRGLGIKAAVDALMVDPDPGGERSPGDRAFIAGLHKFWEGQALADKDVARAKDALTAAESLFGEAIAADESRTAAYLMRGYTRITIGSDIDGGIRDCRRVIAVRPELARAYSYLAFGYWIKGNTGDPAAFALVRTSAETALALADRDGLAHAMLGLAHMGALQRQLRFVYSDDGAVLEAIDDAGRSTAAAAAGELDRAVRDTDDAKERAVWRIQRGWARALAGDLRGARDDLDRDSIQDDPVALTYRAILEYLAGNPAEAGEFADRAIAATPFPMAYQVRAASRFTARDFRGALADMDTAMQLDPAGAGGLAGVAAKLREALGE